jgi:hypothetical protein
MPFFSLHLLSDFFKQKKKASSTSTMHLPTYRHACTYMSTLCCVPSIGRYQLHHACMHGREFKNIYIDEFKIALYSSFPLIYYYKILLMLAADFISTFA